MDQNICIVSLLEDYKNGSDNLRVDLPNDIRDINWDIILVDAPAGYGNDMPCRMKSIYESYELSNDSTDILVHDCEREIEDMYIRLVDWAVDEDGVPDSENEIRGRITPDWKIAPFFEHVKMNEGQL